MENEALRARFEAVDEDRNGKIDEHEFALLLETLSVGFTESQALTAFRAIDVNGSGGIEFSEFASWWSSHSARAVPREARVGHMYVDLAPPSTPTKTESSPLAVQVPR